jgi:predicted ATPase
MLRVVLTGGPGAGKTTVLADLASRGLCTVPDSARAVIAERRRRGQSPRPPPLEFAAEIFHRDAESYDSHNSQGGYVFYERSVVDALGMLNQAAPLQRNQLKAYLARYAYHRMVFVFPPWQAIYRKDAERDQSFAEADAVHPEIMNWYRACGYELVEVPRGPVEQRSAHILRKLPPSDT